MAFVSHVTSSSSAASATYHMMLHHPAESEQHPQQATHLTQCTQHCVDLHTDTYPCFQRPAPEVHAEGCIHCILWCPAIARPTSATSSTLMQKMLWPSVFSEQGFTCLPLAMQSGAQNSNAAASTPASGVGVTTAWPHALPVIQATRYKCVCAPQGDNCKLAHEA